MPFINVKVSTELTKEKKETLKSELGAAVSIIPGKSESWLMVGIEDGYGLYFKGNQDAPTAFVDIKIYGSADADVYQKMTAKVCSILTNVASIPADRVFLSYQEIRYWGWNENNF